jgi:hypothetical protein
VREKVELRNLIDQTGKQQSNGFGCILGGIVSGKAPDAGGFGA